MSLDYKFRDFDEARRSPADIAMGLLEYGNIVIYENSAGTITAKLTCGRKQMYTDHSTITEALAALEAKFNKRGDYAKKD
jgi:hypothetical protein